MAAAPAWDCSPVNGSGSIVHWLGTAALHLTRCARTFTLAKGKEMGGKGMEEAVLGYFESLIHSRRRARAFRPGDD